MAAIIARRHDDRSGHCSAIVRAARVHTVTALAELESTCRMIKALLAVWFKTYTSPLIDTPAAVMAKGTTVTMPV